MTLLFSSVLHFFLLKIYRIVNFFWKNWLVNEFQTAMGGGLLGISKKLFPFSKLDKKWKQSLDSLKSWNVEKGPNFVNCPNFVTIFCRVLKMKIIFLISIAILCPLRSGIHWQINFTKKNWLFCILKKKMQV